MIPATEPPRRAKLGPTDFQACGTRRNQGIMTVPPEDPSTPTSILIEKYAVSVGHVGCDRPRPQLQQARVPMMGRMPPES